MKGGWAAALVLGGWKREDGDVVLLVDWGLLRTVEKKVFWPVVVGDCAGKGGAGMVG